VPDALHGHLDPNWAWVGQLKCPPEVNNGGGGYILTTPIQYLTTIPLDPFGGRDTYLPNQKNWGFVYFVSVINEGASYGPYRVTFRYYMISAGPDRNFWDVDPRKEWVYDPTNGTVSPGDIWYFDHYGFDVGHFLRRY
jgi:hypothetical protein